MLKIAMNSALLVVDVQLGFEDPSWGNRNNPEAEQQIGRLLATWRNCGAPVIHIYHESQIPAGAFVPGSLGSDPKDAAKPQGGELVYWKRVNSAFIGTSLEADLKAAGIDTLFVVGLTTNHCVSTTVRMAANLGFNALVVTDATAAFEGKGIDGKVRSASDVHNGALADLQGEFAQLVDTAAVLKALSGAASSASAAA